MSKFKINEGIIYARPGFGKTTLQECFNAKNVFDTDALEMYSFRDVPDELQEEINKSYSFIFTNRPNWRKRKGKRNIALVPSYRLLARNLQKASRDLIKRVGMVDNSIVLEYCINYDMLPIYCEEVYIKEESVIIEGELL